MVRRAHHILNQDKAIIRWVMGLALVAIVGAAVMWRDRFDAAAVQTWVEGAGEAGPLVFVGIYAVATVLLFPGRSSRWSAAPCSGRSGARCGTCAAQPWVLHWHF